MHHPGPATLDSPNVGNAAAPPSRMSKELAQLWAPTGGSAPPRDTLKPALSPFNVLCEEREVSEVLIAPEPAEVTGGRDPTSELPPAALVSAFELVQAR